MKKTLTLMAALLLTAATGIAQTVNVHKPDGTVITYPADEVDFIDFTPAPDNNPEDGNGNAPAGVEAVDLGLPSGTLWANMNVGATTPEDYGFYFAWGETSPKEIYNWETYKYGYYNYDGDYSHLVNIGSDIAGTSYDAATVNWGAPWRMPSPAQINELLNNCTSEWTTQNGVEGLKFTGPNGGTVFLPAAGYRWDGELSYAGSGGYYWSWALGGSGPGYACNLNFNSSWAYWDYYGFHRFRGLSVRPVR